VAHSGLSGGPSTALELTVSSDSLAPVLRGKIRYLLLFKGRINQHYYTAADCRVIIKVQPKIPPIDSKPELKIDPGYKNKIDLLPS
jgi:hypothetical protein